MKITNIVSLRPRALRPGSGQAPRGESNLFKRIASSLSLLAMTHIVILFLPSVYADDWPQVQHDPQHTGYSPETLGTNFRVDWTYPFQPDRVHPQTQAIIYQGKVYIGTEGANGRLPTLYALYAGQKTNPAMPNYNANAGKVAWTFTADAPILNSAAAGNNRVFFATLNGSVYAVDTDTGQQIWKNQIMIRRGFSAAPILADNKILIGGRNGIFYALNPYTGVILWQTNIGKPIFQTAAYNQGKAFFGAMDMYVYALNSSDGSVAWRSQKIPGTAFKDYWPVVAQGKVLIIPMADRVSPGIVPGWQYDLNWLNQYGPAIASGNMTQVSHLMKAQDDIMANYQANPGRYEKNLFILDENTGQETMTVPHWTVQTMNGATAPPCIDREGKLIVPVSFVGSGWGRLDLSSGRITDILYDEYNQYGDGIWRENTSRTQYPAGFGNEDENNSVSCANNFILSRHINECNGGAGFTGMFNLDTRRWITGIGTETSIQKQMSHNTQGGGTNPFTVSDGIVYDIVFHTLLVRTTN